MDKADFDRLVQECDGDPARVEELLTVEQASNKQVQHWLEQIVEGWEEAIRQEKEYDAYCAAHWYN